MAADMHRAFEEIVDIFQYTKAKGKLSLRARWSQEDGELIGFIDADRDDAEIDKVISCQIADAREVANRSRATVFSEFTEIYGTRTTIVHIITDKKLDFLKKSGKMGNIFEYLKRRYLEITGKRRPKRKQEALPNPEKSPKSYVNAYPRNTKQYKTDVDPDISDRVDEFRRATGMTKREITEAALEAYLNANAPKCGDDGPI